MVQEPTGGAVGAGEDEGTGVAGGLVVQVCEGWPSNRLYAQHSVALKRQSSGTYSKETHLPKKELY